MYINIYTYVFFAGNQLIHCRHHILEFKEKMLRLKNKTERNRQELIKALSKMKYEMTQRKNMSIHLGLCCLCFYVWWFVCWFCVLCLGIKILCFLILGHFSPTNITKLVLVLLLWDIQKSCKRYSTDILPLLSISEMVFLCFPCDLHHHGDPCTRWARTLRVPLTPAPPPPPLTYTHFSQFTILSISQICAHFPITISASQASFMPHLNDC